MPILWSPEDIWTWFNEPVIFMYSDATYKGVFTDTGLVGVARYDHTFQLLEIGNPRGATTGPITVDDHNNPAVIRLNSGKILAAYTEHPGKCWASISPNADSVRGTWTETQLADGTTYYNSYAHLCQTTDDLNTIWWFCRPGASGARPIAFRINQNGGVGANWTTEANIVSLISNAGQRPYFRIAPTGSRIDILYNDGNPASGEASTNSLYHVYMLVSTDGTQFSLYKSDDTLIDTWAVTGGTGTVNATSLPIDVTDGTLVYDGSTSRSWIWDAQWIGGQLHGNFVTFSTTSATDDTHRLWRCSLSGGAWSYESICYGGDSTAGGTVGTVPHWLPTGSPGSNSVYAGGICLDPTTADRVYVSHRTSGSAREIWRWDRVSSSNWTRTSSITGADGKLNSRPFPVLGGSDITYFRGTTYLSWDNYSTSYPGTIATYPLAKSAKESSPVWTPARAPNGTAGYYLMEAGSGTSVADISNTYNGTITGGSLTWGSDSYGANLSGFSNTVAIVADTLASSGFFDGGTFPKWIAMLYKSLTATTGQYLVCFGNSASTNQMFALNINPTTDNQIGGAYRDNAGASNQLSAAKTRDTSYHTLYIVAEAANSIRLFGDARLSTTGTTNTGATTFDRFTIGALRRTSQTNAATGCTLSAVVAGYGGTPSPIHIHTDLINGQFAGTWATDASNFSPWLFMFEEDPYG